MSVLAGQILEGVTWLVDETARELAGTLAEMGGRQAAPGEPVDLALVHVRARGWGIEASAGGQLAQTLTAALAAANSVYGRLTEGGCVLLLADGEGEPAAATVAAVGSLTRTLALEWAPLRRVNAIVCERPADAAELIAMVGGRGGRTMTGSVLRVAGATQG